MLADWLNEQRTNLVYPDGYRHDDALIPIRRRVLRAQFYALDRDAVAMACNASLSKPSSILSALPFVKLPHDSVWIEFANQDVKAAMADLGSPNERAPNTRVQIVRSGFLLRQEGDQLTFEYIHSDKTPEGVELTDLSPILGTFDLSGGRPLPEFAITGSSLPAATRSRLREYIRLVSSDPAEAAAHQSLFERFDWIEHPDMHRIAENLIEMVGPERLEETYQQQAFEAIRQFNMVILPALILLNCRNAVKIEPGPDLGKLNKARIKRGKPPLVEHKVVTIHLTASQRRQAAGLRDGQRVVRGTVVRGHFKVRTRNSSGEKGIFWWSPHARRGYGAVTRSHVVTR